MSHVWFLRARIEYSGDMNAGPKYLRLYQLSFRTDFGLPGMADPFDMCALIELILTQGFLVCIVFYNLKTRAKTRSQFFLHEVPDGCQRGGRGKVERHPSEQSLAGCSLQGTTCVGRRWVPQIANLHSKKCVSPLPGLLPPFSVGFIKGWRRSLAALIICEGIRSLGIEIADLTDTFRVGRPLPIKTGLWGFCARHRWRLCTALLGSIPHPKMPFGQIEEPQNHEVEVVPWYSQP